MKLFASCRSCRIMWVQFTWVIAVGDRWRPELTSVRCSTSSKMLVVRSSQHQRWAPRNCVGIYSYFLTTTRWFLESCRAVSILHKAVLSCLKGVDSLESLYSVESLFQIFTDLKTFAVLICLAIVQVNINETGWMLSCCWWPRQMCLRPIRLVQVCVRCLSYFLKTLLVVNSSRMNSF